MPRVETKEVEKLTNLLVTNAKLKLDCSAYTGKNRKLLIVEGETDKIFFEHVKNETVDCIVAERVFNSDSMFRTVSTGRVNCKDSIVKIIYAITKIPSMIVQYPENLDDWDLYGMVDLDDGIDNSVESLPRLLVTDTHDLETLLLSTDPTILSRLEGCNISAEDTVKAYFVAYQLGIVRKLLSGYYDSKSFDLQKLSCGSEQVNFGAFVKEVKINLADLINYVTEESSEKYSSERIRSILNKTLNGKIGKKYFQTNGLWKQDITAFDFSSIENFWKIVNGHDILQLLQYYNADVFSAFSRTGKALNRGFEVKLIDTYDYSKFRKTKLYGKMKELGLICTP